MGVRVGCGRVNGGEGEGCGRVNGGEGGVWES